MLWSETVFICWGLLFLLLAHNYLRAPNTRSLLWMGICCSLAMITRYAGISLIVTGGWLILMHGDLNAKQKIKQLLLFGVTAAVLPALNLARNLYVHNSLTGVRQKALRSFWQNMEGMAAVFSEWFPFLAGHEPAALLLVIVLLSGALCFLIFRVLQQQYYSGMGTVVAGFSFVYFSFMLLIASISRFEELSSRLLSPAYIPLLLMSTHWLVPFIQNRLAKWRPWLVIPALALYAAIIHHQYKLNAEAWEGVKDAGMPGYTEDSWTQSPTVAYLKTQNLPFAYPVYANANDAVYFLTGQYAKPLPHKEIPSEVEQLQQKQNFYLVWFNDGVNNDLLSLDYLLQQRKVLEIHEFEDGAVYLFGAEQ